MCTASQKLYMIKSIVHRPNIISGRLQNKSILTKSRACSVDITVDVSFSRLDSQTAQNSDSD